MANKNRILLGLSGLLFGITSMGSFAHAEGKAYDVGRISMFTSPTYVAGGIVNIPLVVYSFRTCISNNRDAHRIVSQTKIQISDGFSDSTQAYTDGQGCLIWEEIHKQAAIDAVSFKRSFRINSEKQDILLTLGREGVLIDTRYIEQPINPVVAPLLGNHKIIPLKMNGSFVP